MRILWILILFPNTAISPSDVFPHCFPSWLLNARFADDGLLYRCRVEKELEEDRYVIEYIDHGNKDLKEGSELLILLPAIRDMPVLTRSSQVLLLILVVSCECRQYCI